MSGRKKSLSAKLSRRDPTDDELDASLAEFYSAHDRVAAIMGAALVENTLVGAIKACLDDDSDTGALFYDDKAPFGTFYARIVAAKAFGLVTAASAQDLHVIRDVRNQFAHALVCIDFENEHIAAECEKLRHYPTWNEAPKDRKSVSGSRLHYENACYSFTIQLLTKTASRLDKQAAEAKAQIRNALHPNNALAGFFGLSDLISASLKNSTDDVPNDSRAD